MPSITYGATLSGGGLSIQPAPVIRTDDGLISHEVALPAAKAASAWTKTDDNTGVATLAGGHGLATSDVVDVYWTGGRRYGLTATVATNDITVDGGAGDNFPTTGNLTVVVVKQVVVNTFIDGDALAILGFILQFTDSTITSRGHMTFKDSAPADVANVDLTGNALAVHDIDGGATNGFTGNPIATIRGSNSNTSSAATLKILGAQDTTP